MSSKTKFAIVLPDGAADEPVVVLGGQTPLEAAHTPNMDWISSTGRQGTVVTVPKGFLPGTDVATLSLFGYDPHSNYTGRAPLEAKALGLDLRADQVVFRCNFVTIVDGQMADFTAGHIAQKEVNQLIDDLNGQLAASVGCTFHAGVSYRNLMIAVLPDGVAGLKCTPPHDIPSRSIAKFMPKGDSATWVKKVMERAHTLLKDHEVNLVRSDLGENPVTDIWLWGQGRQMNLESFEAKFGLRSACVSAVDLVHGIASAVGAKRINVTGATGYLDTNYKAKGKAAVAALDTHDLVFVHVESPDEAGHLGDAAAKVEAIERIDEHIVGPLLQKLKSYDRWRILIAPDHPTPVDTRVHTMTPPPFCLAGYLVSTILNKPFSERAALQSDLHIDPGYELMEYFLKS